MPTTQQEVKALKADIAYLKGLLSEAEDTIGDGVSRSLHLTRREIQSLARQVGKNVQEFLRHKGEQIEHGREVAEESIKQRPFAATGAAFLGGALLTLLLWRK